MMTGLLPDDIAIIALPDSGALFSVNCALAPAATWGQNLARSAIPPEIMAGIQAAKQSRKK